MIDDAVNEKEKRQRQSASQSVHRLFGKSVLLIGNDTAVLQNLVGKLAQRGADIAVLCWQIPLEIADTMKERVQSFGRQLILVEWSENQRFTVEQLIHKLATKWGNFDIFIDVSTRGEAIEHVEENDENEDSDEALEIAWPPKWQLTRAVLEEMAHS